MKTTYVNLAGLATNWVKPCKDAILHLNTLFKRHDIQVVLKEGIDAGYVISVKTDPSITGNAVHGRTSTERDDKGTPIRAEIRLPVNVTIHTPNGDREAGPGVLEVIAAHEYVHALGHSRHDTHLMGQTMYKQLGDKPAQDRLKTTGGTLPPLAISTETVTALKAIWG